LIERTGKPDPHLCLEGVLMVGGGVPILLDGELVGAIGVAGSSTTRNAPTPP
jgi:uncharacterized protein GlcG (DUF336 family)